METYSGIPAKSNNKEELSQMKKVLSIITVLCLFLSVASMFASAGVSGVVDILSKDKTVYTTVVSPGLYGGSNTGDNTVVTTAGNLVDGDYETLFEAKENNIWTPGEWTKTFAVIKLGDSAVKADGFRIYFSTLWNKEAWNNITAFRLYGTNSDDAMTAGCEEQFSDTSKYTKVFDSNGVVPTRSESDKAICAPTWPLFNGIQCTSDDYWGSFTQTQDYLKAGNVPSEYATFNSDFNYKYVILQLVHENANVGVMELEIVKKKDIAVDTKTSGSDFEAAAATLKTKGFTLHELVKVDAQYGGNVTVHVPTATDITTMKVMKFDGSSATQVEANVSGRDVTFGVDAGSASYVLVNPIEAVVWTNLSQGRQVYTTRVPIGWNGNDKGTGIVETTRDNLVDGKIDTTWQADDSDTWVPEGEWTDSFAVIKLGDTAVESDGFRIFFNSILLPNGIADNGKGGVKNFRIYGTDSDDVMSVECGEHFTDSKYILVYDSEADKSLVYHGSGLIDVPVWPLPSDVAANDTLDSWGIYDAVRNKYAKGEAFDTAAPYQKPFNYKYAILVIDDIVGYKELAIPEFQILKKGESVTVTFQMEDGTVIAEQEVAVGGTAVPPTATKEGYSFDKWEGSYANVTKDTTVIAKFIPNEYAVTASATDGGSAKIQVAGKDNNGLAILYGTEVTLIATPDKNKAFAGWYDDGGKLISSDSTYTFSLRDDVELEARFEDLEYTVVFKDEGGKVLGAVTVKAGQAITELPEVPAKDGYEFKGWSENVSNVQGDWIVTPVYVKKGAVSDNSNNPLTGDKLPAVIALFALLSACAVVVIYKKLRAQ